MQLHERILEIFFSCDHNMKFVFILIFLRSSIELNKSGFLQAKSRRREEEQVGKMDWRRNMQISRQQIKIWSHPLCPQHAYMHKIRSDGRYNHQFAMAHTCESVLEGEQQPTKTTFSELWKAKAWFRALHHRSVFPSHEPDLASFWQHILSIRAHHPSNGRMRAALGHTVLWHTKN